MASIASRGGLIRLALVLAVLALSGWYVLDNINWHDLGGALAAMSAPWVVLGTATTLVAHLIRAWRWRLLIPSGGSIALRDAFSTTIVGYFMNNVIPRSGEFVRPWALARKYNRPTSELLATIVVERILDGLTLLILLLFLLIVESGRFGQIFPGYSPRSILTAILVPVIAAVLLAVVVVRTTVGERLVGKIEERLPTRFHGRLRKMVGDFRNGLAAADRAGRLKILISSALIWVGYATAIECGAMAFGLNSIAGMTPLDAFSVLAVTSVGITIAPTPGAFGVYHFFAKVALTRIFGVPDELAVAFALVTHAAPYLAITILGAIFVVHENISLREVQRSKSR